MGKLSPWLRHICLPLAPSKGEGGLQPAQSPLLLEGQGEAPRKRLGDVIAFIKTTSDDEQVLAENGCRSLARYGSLHIASIPISRLEKLALDRRVLRIEASPTGHLLMDSMAVHLNAQQAYLGSGLPQAFTGQGVVMGVMDVGFDLTHPNFYRHELTTPSSLTTDSLYRIRRFWDQISSDTIGSPFPVGRDFVTTEDILALGHSRDGEDIAHGTHTLGIAAGSGYDSPYRGMAPDADICLVANAVSEDLPYIDSADVYKYTFATDALGFKYIFDYATSVNKPCVISFSEGSPQDFYGYDQLYYAFIDSLVGPGRILVAAAGNEGYRKSWLHKPAGMPSSGTFLYNTAPTMNLLLKSAEPFTMRLVNYGTDGDTLLIPTSQVLAQPDSMLTMVTAHYQLRLEAYPSCYAHNEICYDLTFTAPEMLGIAPHLSLEVLGTDADITLWRMNGWLGGFSDNPQLNDALPTHCVHSPSSAPNVISVGATTYRDHVTNIDGKTKAYWPGTDGQLVEFSSTGPTMDGRIKPDCVAPGNNIISSYNSFYLEKHPDASDNDWDVARFTFRGRTYNWNCNSGTSMSAPAVGGAIALWLQACPTLSPADVLDILSRTSRHPEPALDYPNNRYGYGEIDVYAGLLDILGLSTIDDIPSTHTTARVSLSGQQLYIELPQPTALPQTLRIYNLAGQPMMSSMVPQGCNKHTISLSGLNDGIYIVCIGSSSTLIRVKTK